MPPIILLVVVFLHALATAIPSCPCIPLFLILVTFGYVQD